MSSHSSPQRLLTRNLGDKVRLATLALALVTAWLSAAGCAGTQAYVPFERETKVSAAARWQALESVAKREQWNVVRSDPQAYTIVAYSNPSGASGVRDRIKVELPIWKQEQGECAEGAADRNHRMNNGRHSAPRKPAASS